MSFASVGRRLRVDPYILALLGTVGIASLLPARGAGAVVAEDATTAAIALLFFLYGARLAPSAAFEGLRHWRLHSVVMISTFVLFPALALLGRFAAPSLLSAPLWTGVIFLAVLPSTVQSSIAFTSIGRGNVPAAICAATTSNLLGILVTPLLAGLVLQAHGHAISLRAIGDIMLQLLLPFAAGQLARPWIAGWTGRHKHLLGYVDRGSILLVVYSAFSDGVRHGIWQQLDLAQLGVLLAVNLALLAAVLSITTLAARGLGFSKEDEITIVFCGSKKSLASGLPMAAVLFSGASVGLIVLPLMLFHQVQLMACAVLARRYAARPVTEDTTPARQAAPPHSAPASPRSADTGPAMPRQPSPAS
jgi:sodium/bile acid cotransporter 7